MKLFLPFLFLIILVSCQKNEYVFIPDQTFVINKDLLIADMVGKPTSYLIHLSADNTVFTGYAPAIIEIPSEALMDSKGNIASGEIKLEVKEYTSTKSALIQCPSSEYEMKPIDSDRLVYLKFSQNGEDLFPIKKVSVYIQDENVINDPNLLVGSLTDNRVTWSKISESLSNISVGTWTISTGETQRTISGYKLEVKGSPRWISISDKPNNLNPTVHKLNVKANQEQNSKNTLAFFVADEKNIMMQLTWNESKSNFGLTTNTQNKNIAGKILIISQLGDNYFEFGMTNAVLGVDTDITVLSSKKDIKEIKSILNSI